MKFTTDSIKEVRAPRREQGSATFVVFVLLLALTALAAANSSTLYWLKRELSALDQQQQKKFQSEESGKPKAPKPGAD